MAARDIRVLRNGGDVLTVDTDDRNTATYNANALEPGEPIQYLSNASHYAKTVFNGAPIRGSDEFLGIVAKQSTETATANGTVDYTSMVTGTELQGKATTTSNVNTAAKIIAYRGNWVSFDNTSEVFTIDENETSDPNKLMLKILRGDHIAYTLDVMVNMANTEAGIWTGQTID